MNCLKVDQGGGGGDGMAALKEPSMASSSGVMTGAASMTATMTSASVSGGGRNIRSWSSSHVDSVGESTHSKNSLVRTDRFCVSDCTEFTSQIHSVSLVCF